VQAHDPALQTSPAWQAVVQLPQRVASGETQAPLQSSNPAWHWHAPLWQVCPVPHALPHAPQFCGSELPFTHADPHAICGAPQVAAPPVPVAPPEPDGAQPEARKM